MLNRYTKEILNGYGWFLNGLGKIGNLQISGFNPLTPGVH